MSGTALDDAITCLVSVFEGAAVPDLEVSDGPNYDPKSKLLLAVGWAGPDTAGASARRRDADAGPSGSIEAIEVACLMSSHDGNLSTAQERRALVDVFEVLETALRVPGALDAYPSLKQVVISADYLVPSLAETGTLASLSFTASVDAFK